MLTSLDNLANILANRKDKNNHYTKHHFKIYMIIKFRYYVNANKQKFHEKKKKKKKLWKIK